MFLVWHFLTDALRTLRANKLRSSLSVLGIVIGIISITVFLAIGQGAKAEMQSYIDDLASKKIDISTQSSSFGGEGETVIKRPIKLTIDDIAFMKNHVKGIDTIIVTDSSYVSLFYNTREYGLQISPIFADHVFGNGQTIVFGTGLDHAVTGNDTTTAIHTAILVNQAFISQIMLGEEPDYDFSRRPSTAEEIPSKGSEFVGQTVGINNRLFSIKGILSRADNAQPRDSPVVYVTVPIYQRFFSGSPFFQALSVVIRDDPSVTVQNVEQQLWYVLLRKNAIMKKSDADLTIRNMSQFQDQQEEFAQTASLILMGIGGIALLVGGIGVMNMMLVSVSERTREIGIRKAIGAKMYHIVGQFLTESVVISIVGGILAIGLSRLIVFGLQKVGVPALMTSDVIAMACAFAGGVGIVFGSLPARKAAKMRPIDALRFE